GEGHWLPAAGRVAGDLSRTPDCDAQYPRPAPSGPPLSGHRSALAELVAEPFDRLRVLALGGAVDLNEGQEERRVRDPGQHVLESALVEAPLALHAPPDRVRAVVELDRAEKALVVRVALREPASAHGVVVLARLRQPVADLVLHGVVDEDHEA